MTNQARSTDSEGKGHQDLANLALPVLAYDAGDGVTIESVTQVDGSKRWVIRRSGSVLNDELCWEYEPMPSGRDEAFMARTRLWSPQNAQTRLRKLPVHRSQKGLE